MRRSARDDGTTTSTDDFRGSIRISEVIVVVDIKNRISRELSTKGEWVGRLSERIGLISRVRGLRCLAELAEVPSRISWMISRRAFKLVGVRTTRKLRSCCHFIIRMTSGEISLSTARERSNLTRRDLMLINAICFFNQKLKVIGINDDATLFDIGCGSK